MSDATIEDRTDTPAGWTQFNIPDDFVIANGPLFFRIDAAEGPQLGMRLAQRHCNALGVCHGGMLTTFADMMTPMASHHHPEIGRRFLPTISLHTDFIAGAQRGAWLVGRPKILRVTRKLVFAEGLIFADETLVARINAIHKIGAPLDALIAERARKG